MEKIPPYGKPLYDLIKSGFKPNNDIKLFIGNKAWEKGKNFSISYPHNTLILPPWFSPQSYYWPVKQCDVLIFDTAFAKEEYIEELATSLYEQDANKVRFVNSDYELIVFHKE
jgi:hypothetical protein